LQQFKQHDDYQARDGAQINNQDDGGRTRYDETEIGFCGAGK